MIHSAITRELPNHYPFIITRDIIQKLIGTWNVPAQDLFEEVENIVTNQVKLLVDFHFKRYPRLKQSVLYVHSKSSVMVL